MIKERQCIIITLIQSLGRTDERVESKGRIDSDPGTKKESSGLLLLRCNIFLCCTCEIHLISLLMHIPFSSPRCIPDTDAACCILPLPLGIVLTILCLEPLLSPHSRSRHQRYTHLHFRTYRINHHLLYALAIIVLVLTISLDRLAQSHPSHHLDQRE